MHCFGPPEFIHPTSDGSFANTIWQRLTGLIGTDDLETAVGFCHLIRAHFERPVLVRFGESEYFTRSVDHVTSDLRALDWMVVIREKRQIRCGSTRGAEARSTWMAPAAMRR